jgi:hypothetical protein
VVGSQSPRPRVDDLAARFEACAIPAAEWTHEAHLIVGLWHVDRYGPDEALERLRSGIRRLNESHGGVNSATDGYHETITAAYVQLFALYFERCAGDMRLEDRIDQFLDSPLAAKRALAAFYTTEHLMSTTARAEWVEPDVAPFDASTALDAATQNTVQG